MASGSEPAGGEVVTIAETVVRHAVHPATAGRDALVVDDRRHTYGDLAGGIRATAAALTSSGVARRPQSRAGLLLEPGARFFEAFLGAGAAGMAAMVLQRSWSDRDLHHALAAGRPRLVLVDAGSADRVGAHLPERAVVRVGADGVAGALARWAGGPVSPPHASGPPVDDATPFYVGFTSGTTGRPKGFIRSHRSWLRSFDASAAVFAITRHDRVLAPGPLDHSLFLYAAVHGLSVGATVHLHRRFTPAAVLASLDRHPISHVYLVPTMLAALLRAADRAGRPRYAAVTSVICSGARWPAAVQDRVADLFPNAEPIDFYGASELSFVSVRRLNAGDPAASVGHPFPGVEVAVRRDDGTAADVGEAGRLWVRSDMVFSGYLEPDAVGATRDPAGWVTVGDIARRDAEGRLYLLGREGAMLVCGGVNVFPEEIEDVLLGVPEVAEAAVVGIPDDYWGDLLCAVVCWRDGRAVPRERLREHCRAHLARGKRPQRWLQATALPRTSGGKIARATLAQRVRDGTLAAEEFR
jgi:long-chain acyl-CoA synthetase